MGPEKKWPEQRWLWRAGLKDKKGGDFEQMPEELRVREVPHPDGQVDYGYSSAAQDRTGSPWVRAPRKAKGQGR